jgi:deoxyribodipyrimidine photo-lyase
MRKHPTKFHICVLLFCLSSISGSMGLSTTRVANKAAQKGGVVFHWFRLGDLRLHDNPALDRSAKICDQTESSLVPVFCFDPRIFGDNARSEFGSLKCGPRRAKFVLESVADLRQSLERKGSKLVVAYAKPEDVFSQLLQDCKDSSSTGSSKILLVYQDEVCSEERAVEHKVKKLFQSSEAVWGSTMYDLKDLPYDVDNNLSDMPDTFTPFRNQVEKNCQIRAPLPPPKKLPSVPPLDTFPALGPHNISFLPTLEDLGYTKDQIQSVATNDPRGVMEFKGGETAALARVKDYIWDKDLLHKYFDTRNGMIGADYSTKFAPWLAHGNLSPRYVARECKKYEEERVANKSTYWVVFEMLWRDFFKLFALKHGESMFFPGGTMGSKKEWKHYEKNVRAWTEGRTGFPLVDANMRELAATGFMSNRGRQNVCSFLTLELNQDWRYGADYFESTLLDYDVHSNWGNWCSGAGMTGGRLNRFNIVKQSKDYDRHGDYVRLWLPELKNVPTQFVHEPWKMNQFQQMEYGCQLGVDYPNPVIPPFYPDPKGGSRSKGDRGGGKSGNRDQANKNRSRGQTKDMKSLKTGKFSITG